MSSVITVDELSADSQQAVDRAESGETLLITRNGNSLVELRPIYPARPVHDAAWHAAYTRMIERMEKGIFSEPVGTITYEDKHGRAPL